MTSSAIRHDFSLRLGRAIRSARSVTGSRLATQEPLTTPQLREYHRRRRNGEARRLQPRVGNDERNSSIGSDPQFSNTYNRSPDSINQGQLRSSVEVSEEEDAPVQTGVSSQPSSEGILFLQSELHLKFSNCIREENVKCIICLEEFEETIAGPSITDAELRVNLEPIVTLCGHLMCGECFHFLRESQAERSELKCPMCRRQIQDI